MRCELMHKDVVAADVPLTDAQCEMSEIDAAGAR